MIISRLKNLIFLNNRFVCEITYFIKHKCKIILCTHTCFMNPHLNMQHLLASEMSIYRNGVKIIFNLLTLVDMYNCLGLLQSEKNVYVYIPANDKRKKIYLRLNKPKKKKLEMLLCRLPPKTLKTSTLKIRRCSSETLKTTYKFTPRANPESQKYKIYYQIFLYNTLNISSV